MAEDRSTADEAAAEDGSAADEAAVEGCGRRGRGRRARDLPAVGAGAKAAAEPARAARTADCIMVAALKKGGAKSASSWERVLRAYAPRLFRL